MPERKLIYADTVVEKLSELILLGDHEKKVLESFVETCLAVDAEPVVHGRWTYTDGDYEVYMNCSECGWDDDFRTNYCPNCGAKMDGGGQT